MLGFAIALLGWFHALHALLGAGAASCQSSSSATFCFAMQRCRTPRIAMPLATAITATPASASTRDPQPQREAAGTLPLQARLGVESLCNHQHHGQRHSLGWDCSLLHLKGLEMASRVHSGPHGLQLTRVDSGKAWVSAWSHRRAWYICKMSRIDSRTPSCQ